jgi:hypothetical protein
VGHEFSWFSWIGQSTNLRSVEILSQQILLTMSLFYILVDLLQTFVGSFPADFREIDVYTYSTDNQVSDRLNPFAIFKKLERKLDYRICPQFTQSQSIFFFHQFTKSDNMIHSIL